MFANQRMVENCVCLAVLLAAEQASCQTEFLQFQTTNIDSGVDALTAVTIGPDGHLYFAEQDGDIFRHQLDPATGLPIGSREPLFDASDRISVGLEFSPNAAAENLEVFVTYNTSGSPFSSRLARATLPSVGEGGLATRTDLIVGLPNDSFDHVANQPRFGPDGRLYFSVGSTSPAGATEAPLSAATLVVDVLDPSFQPVNVDPNSGYDPTAPGAPVTVFAPGVRNSYDLVWHSNGELYAPINGNDNVAALSPQDPDAPGNTQIVTRPDEQLALVRENVFYGHPNPARGEFISHGGNPTAGPDGDWELAGYPIDTLPEPAWDESLNFNLLDSQPFDNPLISVSPNGIDEFTARTGLEGRLLVAFFRTFDRDTAFLTLALDEMTGLVTQTDALLDENGDTLLLPSALDLVVDEDSGRIYVAGHGSGNLFLLSPLEAPSVLLPGDYNDDGVVDAADYTVWRDNLDAPAGALPNDVDGGVIGVAQYLSFVQNFGRSTPPSVTSVRTAVPEPTSFLIILSGCCLAWGRQVMTPQAFHQGS